MYVCICKAVSESRIRKAAQEEGVCTLRELRLGLGVGTGCGKCVPLAYEVLSAAQADKTATAAAGGECFTERSRVNSSR